MITDKETKKIAGDIVESLVLALSACFESHDEFKKLDNRNRHFITMNALTNFTAYIFSSEMLFTNDANMIEWIDTYCEEQKEIILKFFKRANNITT